MKPEKQSDRFQVRPRFSMDSKYSIETIEERVKSILVDRKTTFEGKSTLGYFTLYPAEKHHHNWSPHLSVIVEETENGSHLRGHYGPSPSVWTMFVFLYAVIGCSAVICLVIGFANRSIGLSAQILWLVPVLVLAFLSLYFVSFFGQKKGHDQMEMLHEVLQDIVL